MSRLELAAAGPQGAESSLPGDPVHRGQQLRLADPGRAGDGNHGPAARIRLLEQGIQLCQLRIPLQQQRLGPGNSHHAPMVTT
jgi:hypothetical protein